MTRKGHAMDIYFQKHNIKRHLRAQGIQPDTIDSSALLDRTLRYPENIENIDRILQIRKQKDYKELWRQS
jgi:hypothetical protein